MEKTYKEIIKELREDKDKTQTEIAKILHTHYTVYQRYELGTAKMPIHHLTTLADFYQVPTDYILGRTDVTTPYPRKAATPAVRGNGLRPRTASQSDTEHGSQR